MLFKLAVNLTFICFKLILRIPVQKVHFVFTNLEAPDLLGEVQLEPVLYVLDLCLQLQLEPLPLLLFSPLFSHHLTTQGIFNLFKDIYRQRPIFRRPFFRKQCFSLKYSLVSPPQNFWGMSEFGIYVTMKSNLQL